MERKKKPVKKFNMQMNIAKAIGIALIVTGHCTWDFLSGGLIPLGYYHVAVFFFIAGYFVKDSIFESVKNVFSASAKLLLKWTPRFYAYHWVYGLITFLIFTLTGIKYGYLPDLFNMTVEPFFKVVFTLDSTLWFIVQLITSLILFYILMFILKKRDNLIAACLFVILMSVSIYFANDSEPTRPYWLCFVARTLYTLFIVYAGYFYKNYLEDKISDKSNKLKLFLICCVINMIVFIFCQGKINFALNAATFSHSLASYICPLVGIYMVLFISEMMVPYVKEGSLIDKMGKNSFHIMINHMFVFYILQTIIFSISVGKFAFLPQDMFIFGKKMYLIGQYKYFYAMTSLVVCTYFAEFQKYAYNRFVEIVIPAIKNKVFKKA